jgi:hypothetical protein
MTLTCCKVGGEVKFFGCVDYEGKGLGPVRESHVMDLIDSALF